MADAAHPTENEAHWEQVYSTRRAEDVSWFTPHLKGSLRCIQRYAPRVSDAIIDVGGGASTLAEDLRVAGYTDITVLDIAESALHATRQRMGAEAEALRWLRGDITTLALPRSAYDLWHDRAVFHFLVRGKDREAYVRQLSHALRPGGHLVMATFGPEGPQVCSDLPTKRYDAVALAAALGPDFTLKESSLEVHATPFETAQQFLYACFQYKAA